MQRFLYLLLFSILIRLLILPYSSSTDADATSRIFIAWQWLDNSREISYRGWGPLHFYLIGGALYLWLNPVYSPIVLHILFSVLTAVPLWMFVRREWGESPALFVAAAYLFYPIAFRFSFTAVSEIPFAFFVTLAMLFLSMARTNMKIKYALLAGLSLTLAAALRYEAWILIPLFAVVLWKKWNLLVLYLVAASVFPFFAMINNVMDGHQLLPEVAREWQIDIGGINENLSGREIFRRLIYFPSIVLFGLTPLIFLLCVAGIVQVWKKRRENLVWLIPFLGLLSVLIIQCVRGHVLMAARYSIVLGILLLPFSAETIARIGERKKAIIIAVLTIFSILPFSYSRVILARINPSFPNPFPANMEMIPKVGTAPKEIARIVRNNLGASDGLIVDFFGNDFYPWKDTYYVALMSHAHPDRIYFLPGERYEKLQTDRMATILKAYPSGVLLRTNQSRFLELHNSEIQIADVPLILDLKPIQSVRSITIYRYNLRK